MTMLIHASRQSRKLLEQAMTYYSLYLLVASICDSARLDVKALRGRDLLLSAAVSTSPNENCRPPLEQMLAACTSAALMNT